MSVTPGGAVLEQHVTAGLISTGVLCCCLLEHNADDQAATAVTRYAVALCCIALTYLRTWPVHVCKTEKAMYWVPIYEPS